MAVTSPPTSMSSVTKPNPLSSSAMLFVNSSVSSSAVSSLPFASSVSFEMKTYFSEAGPLSFGTLEAIFS